MNCPTCGAPMRLEEDKDYLICDYCKSMHFPEPDADGVRVLGEPAPQSCPVCGIPLLHATVCGRRILSCGRCHGILIPMGTFVIVEEELRAQRGPHVPPEPPRVPNPKDLDRRISCPCCHRRVDTHPYLGPGHIIIDSCSDCHLDWLDYGELMRTVRGHDHHLTPDE